MDYAKRRADVLARLDGAAMVVPAARHQTRNADTTYEYRQDSDFYYLTGFLEPEAVLVLTPQRRAAATLFLRPKDREREIWDGKRLGVEDAPAALGVDAAYPIDELEARLPEMLVGAPRLYARLGLDEAFDRVLTAAVGGAKYAVRRGGIAPEAYVDPGALVHEMRLRKTPEEIAVMQRAADATRDGHVAGMRATRPGLREWELEAIIESRYRLAGAQDVAYPSIVAGGDNATILHYNTNRETLRDGELVLVDSGAEVDLYACDVTRTWPVNGRFTQEQRAIYEIVLDAQKAAIEDIRVGTPYRRYHETAVRVITEGLVRLGLLRGEIDALIADEAYKRYYMHNTGHYLGLDVHDAGKYRDEHDAWRSFEAGVVCTVEPGIYVHRDADCDPRWHGIGVRIEDDVLCAPDGPVVLTAAIPKEIDELETIVGADALART